VTSLFFFAIGACTPKAVSPPVDTGGDTDTDTVVDPDDTAALAADDARVRALTGLPEGDVACAEPILGRVRERTVDGDTLYVQPEAGGDAIDVRVIGVDAPEIEHEDPAECYGNEAWEWATEQLGGKLVWLTFDADCLDPYDRTLAYVFRGDDDAGFFNRALARNGYAVPLEIAPDDTYADEIAADARAARDEGAGLWGACDR
jgi:micrococcal nuclease